jgi:hypothetical protein
MGGAVSDTEHACLLLQSAETAAEQLRRIPARHIDQEWLAQVIRDFEQLRLRRAA